MAVLFRISQWARTNLKALLRGMETGNSQTLETRGFHDWMSGWGSSGHELLSRIY
jgi:hypothetical protein